MKIHHAPQCHLAMNLNEEYHRSDGWQAEIPYMISAKGSPMKIITPGPSSYPHKKTETGVQQPSFWGDPSLEGNFQGSTHLGMGQNQPTRGPLFVFVLVSICQGSMFGTYF